jgi:hypothetical protein
MGFQIAMGDLGAVYANPNTYKPGQTAELNDREYKFIQYNDGDGNIPGLRGQVCYAVGANAANVGTAHEVTCDLGSATVVSQDDTEGLIMPNVILNGEFCWIQKVGMGLTRGEFPVYMWADGAIDRSADSMNRWLVAGASDGTVVELTDGVEETIFAANYADVDAVPTAAADRFLASIPAGQTTTAQFAVGETVTANTDTAVVVEVLSRGTTDYGLIVSTVTADYWAATETAVGGTSAASGVIGVVGYAVFPQNYRLLSK